MPTLSDDPKTWVKMITGLYILKILINGPAHGNKIADEIKRRTSQYVMPNPNALYPLLRIMEERGYIVGEWSNPEIRSKRVYTITGTGRESIASSERKVAGRLSEMERKIQILRKDLLGKQLGGTTYYEGKSEIK